MEKQQIERKFREVQHNIVWNYIYILFCFMLIFILWSKVSDFYFFIVFSFVFGILAIILICAVIYDDWKEVKENKMKEEEK